MNGTTKKRHYLKKEKTSAVKLVTFFAALIFICNGLTVPAGAEPVNSPIADDNYTLNFSYFRPNDAKFIEFSNRFKSAADNYSTSFNISDLGLSKDIAKAMYLEFVFTNPEYFYVSDRGYSASTSTITISYYSDMKTQHAKDAFVAATNKLLATIPANATPLEKVILVHDYIALNTMYAYNDSGQLDPHHSPYHVLVDSLATCTGFSTAYSFIMNQLGVETLTVEGEPYVDHMWNLVKLDGKWYHVDVTHALSRSSSANRKVLGLVKHEEFLQSDATRLEYSQWYSLTPPATDAIYETAFWQTVRTAFVSYDGRLLYFAPAEANPADNNRLTVQNLMSWDVETGERTPILSFVAKWLAPDSRYYVSKMPFLALHGDKLFYNTPSEIRYLDLATMTDHEFLKEPAVGTQQIFEMAIKNGILTYRIKADSSVSSAVIKEQNVNLSNDDDGLSTASTVIRANANATISISSGGSVTLDVIPTADGSITTAKDTVTVSTNSNDGYNLTLSTVGSNNTLASGSDSIPASMGTQTSPVALAANTWGYRVDNLVAFGAGPTTTVSNVATESNTWAGVPIHGTPNTIKSTDGISGGDATTIWYGLNSTTETASGNYANTVVYTAVAH